MPFIWQLIDLLLLFHRWCPCLPFFGRTTRILNLLYYYLLTFFRVTMAFIFIMLKLTYFQFSILNPCTHIHRCIFNVTNSIFCCVLTAASASSSGHPETPVTRGIMTSPYGMRDHTHFTHIQPPQVRGNHKHIMLAIICMFRGTSVNGGSVVLSQIK